MQIRFRPPFSDSWSSAAFSGDDGFSAMQVLASRLLAVDFEVEFEEEGEFVDYSEADLGCE